MKRFSILLVLVLIAQIFIPQGVSACTPDIYVNPTYINFGSVPIGSVSLPQVVTIYNKGTGDLVINNIGILGDDPTDFMITSEHSVPKTIPKLSSYTYTLKFSPDSAGQKAAYLFIYSNDSDERVVYVELYGTGTIVCRPNISVDPLSIPFGDVLVSTQSAAKNVTVKNQGTSNLILGTLTINNNQFGISGINISGQTLVPNASAIISLVFTPSTAGPKSASLTIPSNDPNHSSVIVSLSGNGITPDISVGPTPIDFGNVLVGVTSTAQNVTVTNNGTANLTIGNLTISDGQFTIIPSSNISGQTLAPTASAVISLVFKPAAAGPQSATLTIPSNVPNKNVYLSGTGTILLKPDISVGPPIDFGDVLVGTQSAAKNVTVTNNGTANLTISTLSISDTQFTIFGDNISGQTLIPGASKDIVLVFTPSTAGHKSANLTITSNVPGTVTVALSGNGIIPNISVDPTPIDFGDVLVGTQSAAKNVTVTNTGTANLTISTLSINDSQFTIFGVNISGQTLIPGASKDIVLVFTPSTAGHKSANLTITSNVPGTVTVALSGNGTIKPEPDISVGPPIDFGYVQVAHQSAPLTVTVTNIGTAKLIISGLEIINTQFVITADNVTTLAPGGTANITIVFTPAAVGHQSANLTITSNDPDQGTLDVPLSGIGSEGPVAPDIFVTPLSVPFGDVLVGDNSTAHDVTVTNNGTADLIIGTLTISDTQFTIFGDNISDDTLIPGASEDIVLVFKPAAAGPQSATLTIPSNVPVKPPVTVALSGNGTGPTADLKIAKTDSLDPVAFGDNFTYTLTVTNDGPDSATGVAVTDTLPVYVNYISSNASTGNASITAGTINWDIGSLTDNASATLDIVVTLKPMVTVNSITNNATVSGKEYDPHLTNNSASENTAIRYTDLQITKTDFPDPIGYTGNVTWVVTVTNNGPENASNVVVIDTYASAYAKIQSITTSNGTTIPTAPQWLVDYATQTGLPILTSPAGESQLLWGIGDLASGASVNMTVVASANFTLPLSPFELKLLALMGLGLLPNYILPNSALVLSTLADPNFNNNTAHTITSTDPGIPNADLAITKTGDPKVAVPGDNVTYTITVRNNGSENATGVFVLDGWMKSELSLQSAVPSTGTANQTLPSWLIDAINKGPTPPADAGFLFWNVGNLAVDESATLTITASANADASTPIINFAVVSGPVLDANPTNNYAWSETSLTQADLAIIKTDSPDPVIAGDNLTYTLTVTNNGPADATGVIATDTLPASTVYESATTSTGNATHSSGVVTWDIGALAYRDSATLTIVVKAPPDMGVITNTANVSGNQVDLNTLNNTATADTFVVPFGNLPDITVAPPSLDFGSVALNTPSVAQLITVTNNGTVNLVIGSLTISNGQFTISSGNISGQTLAPNAPPAVMSITFTPSALGLQSATLSITSNDPDESLVNVALSGYGTTPSPPPGPPPGPPEPTPTPTPPPPPQPEVQYFTVDFLGLITKEVATSDGRPVANMAAPSPDGLHLLEIEALTGASVNESTVTTLKIIETQAPQLPENTQLVGKAYEFMPSGTIFDKPIKLTLGYNVDELPEGVISVGAAYYTSQDGWTYLDTESSTVAELGKLTATVNHFTVFAVLAKVPPTEPVPTPEPTPTPTPPPAPAQFNLSNLNITTSVSRIFEKFSYIIRTGEEAVITADVTNGGGQPGTYTAILVINGTERERKDITLQPGQTGTVSFTVTGNDEGTYTVVIGTLTDDFLSDLWINWWLIVATIAVLILIAWLVWYIIQRRKRREAPSNS